LIPLPIRIAISLLGAGMLAASFVIRTSVDRGLEIRRDTPPPLTTDAGVFTMRVLGAFVLGIGLLTWVVARSYQTHTGIF
jgi:uncharacterized membrane protein YidH (DUF202 family)